MPENAERAAALLERLLSDPIYRAEFRADPARACAEEGLPEVASELGRGRAMQTLEIRESRSSLAGVLMAAALEGASLAVLVDHAEAAGTVDPTAASALQQLTQNHQAVSPPIDPTAPADATGAQPVGGSAPVAVDPTAVSTPAAPVDPTAAQPVDPTSVSPPAATDPPVATPPPVVDAPPPVDPPAPAVDVIGTPPTPPANGPSVQFLPAVAQTDPSTLPPATPVAPLSAVPVDSATPVAPAQPVTGVLQQVAQGQQAAVQAPATVGALPAVQSAADHVDALAVASGPNPYPGDNAGQAAIAAWMARDAQAAGLPPELPVMASLVESGLTNMPGGDRDSMGFFQMRAGIWDRGEYAGYSQNPELQMKWFIDHALAIKAKRIAEGDATYGQDPQGYGNWVADIEVPYEPYRGRYQLRLEDAQSLLAQSSAQPAGAAAAPVADAAVTPAAPAAPIPAADVSGPVIDIAPGVPVMDADAASPTALAAIKVAAQYLGTSYHFGGASPETGFDCSGLMQWSYSHVGVSIPRVTYDQIDVGIPVDRAHLVPGDLVFFQHDGDVHHVGMYLGGGRFLQAPHTGDVVKVSSLDEPYYAEQFAGGRRMA
jgi:cell wall-associated NlpC family hydrolase